MLCRGSNIFFAVSLEVVAAEAGLLLFHPDRDGGFNRFLGAFHHITYNSFWNGQFGVHIMWPDFQLVWTAVGLLRNWGLLDSFNWENNSPGWKLLTKSIAEWYLEACSPASSNVAGLPYQNVNLLLCSAITARLSLAIIHSPGLKLLSHPRCSLLSLCCSSALLQKAQSLLNVLPRPSVWY